MKIQLDFTAPGTNGSNPPAAETYLIKQSLRPIRDQRDFATAQALCHGACRFAVTQVGGNITLTITNLRPHTTYYYAIAALDNVTARPGPHSQTVTRKQPDRRPSPEAVPHLSDDTNRGAPELAGVELRSTEDRTLAAYS